MDRNSSDAELISKLGGPAEIARRLGFEKSRGTQRVSNWITRGIPVRIKYEHPELFGSPKSHGLKSLAAESNLPPTRAEEAA